MMTQPDNAQTIFEQVFDLPPPRRSDELDRLCGPDGALRTAVATLLTLYDSAQAEGFLDQPFMTPAADSSLGAVEPAANTPDSIGRYRITGRLGAGSAGVVYCAESPPPTTRRVAVKVLRSGAPKSALERFRIEQRALATLNHPGIAQIFDSGLSDSGELFAVFEFIEGQTINDYVANAPVDWRECLELIVQVCDAVQHAHQRGVIHRDLKPSNIMVSIADGSAVVKVIDFGVSKLTHAPSQTTQTEHGRLVGTFGYMAPELLAGERVVDTRVDVYAIGIILFELLQGRHPYHDYLHSLPELVRVVRQGRTPALLGTHLGCKRDLDAIIRKATRTDMEQRYASPQHFADDLRRVLAGRTIEARPPSMAYAARKFATRRPRLVTAGTLVLVLLMVLLYLTIDAGSRARLAAEREANQRRRAEQETLRQQATLRFMIDLFRAASPGGAAGREVRVADALQLATGTIKDAFKDDAPLEIAIRSAIGEVHSSLGENDQGLAHLERAWQLAQASGDTLDRYEVLDRLLAAYLSARRTTTALSLMSPFAAELERPPLESTHLAARLRFRLGHAQLENGHTEAAERTLLAALDEVRRLESRDKRLEAQCLAGLGAVDYALGRLDAAYDRLYAAYELLREAAGLAHPETLSALADVGVVLNTQGRSEEAWTLQQDLLEEVRGILGDRHLHTAAVLSNISDALVSLDRYEEADDYLAQAIEIRRQHLPDDHYDIALTRYKRARCAFRRGSLPDAEKHLAACIEPYRRELGDDDSQVLLLYENLGQTLYHQKKLVEAETFFERAYQGRLKQLGPTHHDTRQSLESFCTTRLQLGLLDDRTEQLLREFDASHRLAFADHPAIAFDAAHRLAWLLLARGKTANLAELAADALVHCRTNGVDSSSWLVLQALTLVDSGSGKDLDRVVREMQRAAETAEWASGAILGWQAQQEGNAVSAAEHFETALADWPDQPWLLGAVRACVYSDWGEALAECGRFDAAAVQLKRAGKALSTLGDEAPRVKLNRHRLENMSSR